MLALHFLSRLLIAKLHGNVFNKIYLLVCGAVLWEAMTGRGFDTSV